MCPHTILLRVRTYSHTPTICIAHLPLLLLYGAQAAQVQGLLRGNTKPSIFLRLPGSSMLDPVCQVLTLLLSLLALLVQKYKNCNMPAIFLCLPGSSMRAPSLPCTQFTCVTGTKVQILTQKALPKGRAEQQDGAQVVFTPGMRP